MNRLSFHKKFLLLGIICLVAVCITIYSLYSSLNQTISRSKKELDGLALIRPVAETIQSVQKHRGLSSGVLGGISNLEAARTAREIDTSKSFVNLEAHLPATSLQNESWKNIRALWQRLQTNGMQRSRADNFDAHTHLIDEMLLFESALADEYGLTSDPDLDTFYLIYTSDNELLKALEHLGQIRAYGTGILGEKNISQQQMEAMNTLITLLTHSLTPLKVSMKKAAHYNPSLQNAIMATYENIETSSLQVVDEVHSDILSKRFSMRPDEFFAVTTAAIDHGYAQIYQSLLPTTEKLIQTRIQHAKNALQVTVGIAFLLVLLAAYFMTAFYYATIGSIQTLSQSVINFVRGDMLDRVHLNTRDELTKIGISFNTMADELTELISARQAAGDRMQAIFDSALDAMVQINANGIVTGWNKQAEMIFGWGQDDILGQPLHKFIIPLRHQEAHLQGMKRFLSTGEGTILNTRVEIDGLHRDGHEFPIELTIASIKVGDQFEFNAFVRDLTARTAVEKQLRFLSTAIEQSPTSVVITNPNAEIEYVNPHFCLVTGYSHDEAIGQNPRILNSGQTPASVYQSLWSNLTKGLPWTGEFINKRKNGEVYREEAYISPVKDAAGNLSHYVAVKLDISLRVNIEQRERIRNQVLEQLTTGVSLEKILESIVLGIEQERPDSLCSILLLDDMGKHLFMGAAPNLPDFYNEAIDGLAIGDGVGSCGTAAFRGESVIAENLQQHPYWISYTKIAQKAGLGSCWSYPIKNQKGHVLGTFAIYHKHPALPTDADIQIIERYGNLAELVIERSRAQNELRIAATAFESQEGIMVTDADGLILRVNQSFSRITGYLAEEVLGKNPRILSSGRQNKAFYASMWQSIVSTGSWEGEIWDRHKSGLQYPVWISIAAVKNESGQVTHYVTTMNDITEHKKVEAATLLAKEQAVSLARYKSEFLANMSHEIRTPMNGIIGLSQLALNQPTTPAVRDYLQKISSSSESLLGILNDILDFSKMEAGRMSIENEPFDLDQIVDNLRNLFEERAVAKHLDFAIEIADGTPRDLIGDTMRIQQILSNLLGNAIKFTAQGHVALKIGIKQMEHSHVQLTFSVEDTGIGIAKQDIGKLFQPFSQTDGSITRRFGGTGLGLAISHSLLQLMGGDFKISSQPGQGTTFSFDLLLGIAAHATTRKTRHRAKREAGELEQELQAKGSSLNGSSILVVEDNRINQQVIKEFLKLSGIEVTLVNNGQEALDILKKQDFDAILMDVHMPIMGGVEATRHLRTEDKYASLPIIALTAGVTQEERENCFNCGMNDFIAKPVNPESLIATLMKWLVPNSPSDELHTSETQNEWDVIATALPDFDFSTLKTMIGSNSELLRNMLQSFLTDFAGESDMIMSAIQRNEITVAEKLLHRIKGVCGSLGATELHTACETLDAQLKKGGYSSDSLNTWFRIHNRIMVALAGFLAK